MKLRNKLIPLLTIAATASTVAPIAASCGARSVLSDDTLDITSPFTPTIARAEKHEEAVEPAKALDIYMSNVMANPDILKQDIWYYEAKKLPSRISRIEHTFIGIDGTAEESETEKYSSVTDVTATVNVSDVEAVRHEAIIKGQKTEFYTISMNIGYAFKFTATSLATEPRVQLTKSIDFQSTYTNIPVYMYKADNMWFLSINLFDSEVDPYLQQLPTWSLVSNLTSSYDCTVSTHGLSQNFSDSRSISDNITRRSQVYEVAKREQQYDIEEYGKYCTLLGAVADLYMNFASYHMANVARPADMVTLAQPANKINATRDGEGKTWYFGDGETAGIFKSSDEAKALSKEAQSVELKVWNGEDLGYKSSFQYPSDDEGCGTLYCKDYASLGADDRLRIGTQGELTVDSDGELYLNYFNFKLDDGYLSGESYNFVIPAGTTYKIIWTFDGGEEVDSGDIIVANDFEFKVFGHSE